MKTYGSGKDLYRVAQHPETGKWYAIGWTGGRYWVPVSSPYDTKAEAVRYAEKAPLVDRSARADLGQIGPECQLY